MEVNVKLTITSEEFFDAVAEAIVYDVHQCTGKNIRAKNIKRGMSYTKKANKRQSYTVTITEYDYPKCYSARIDSTGGSNLLSYQVEELEDGIGVSYKEEMIKANGKSKDSGFASIFAKAAGIRRAKKQLSNIQDYVLSKRKEAETAAEEKDPSKGESSSK